nr:hypothetical protein GCM10020092_002930 [Actinoplanes digitatis]
MLGGELSRAVAEHEFVVDFQPIVDLGSGEVISAEALARWHHPEHGSLSPMQFLETVERSGQLPAFADAVLEQSLTAYRMWREAGFDLPVAVNVSPRSLLDETFPSAVLSRLAGHGVAADRLVLELAETLTLSQLEVVDRALSELRNAGVRLALDDFGTGVSSLSVLSRVPVHQLKIDREFVTAVETSSEAAAVIRSTVDLARSLHLTVVAEGVESEPQRHALWELGCVAQPGPPLRAADVLRAAARLPATRLGRAPGCARRCSAQRGFGRPDAAPQVTGARQIRSATLARVTLLRRLDQALDGLAADAALYGLAAAFALVTALTSTLPSHRAWGAWAVWAYLAAFSVVVIQLVLRRPRWRMGLTWATWCGAVLLPLIVQAVQRAAGHAGRAQEEVLVVEHMGERLARTGTPYLGPDAIAALPAGRAAAGLRAVPARHGRLRPAESGLRRRLVHRRADLVRGRDGRDPGGGRMAARRPRPTGPPASLVRAMQFATVLPVCALTLATGGDDLPVLTLTLLALACCATGRYGAAGLAVGAAAALKLFALPVVVVLAVCAIVTGNGRRFLPGALGLPVLALLPAFLVDADAFVENVIRFPLGHGLVTSPAQSPFPGYLISQAVPGGRYVALALLVAVALAIAVRLVRRPPRTAATAALFCGYGLLAAILLMPTTRFGYLLYPLALLVWAPALAEALSRSTGTAAPRSDPALYRL